MRSFIYSINVKSQHHLPTASDLYPLGSCAQGGHILVQGDSYLHKWSYRFMSRIGNKLEPGEEAAICDWREGGEKERP